MKVKFLKDFMQHKKDDVIEVDESRANYWIKVKVAEKAVEKKQIPPKKEKNSKAGPKNG